MVGCCLSLTADENKPIWMHAEEREEQSKVSVCVCVCVCVVWMMESPLSLRAMVLVTADAVD
jgi:hypothetical protein